MEGLCNFKEMVRESFTRKKKSIGEFPGGPVVRTRHSQCQGPDSISGWGTKIPRALWLNYTHTHTHMTILTQYKTFKFNSQVTTFLNWNFNISASHLGSIHQFSKQKSDVLPTLYRIKTFTYLARRGGQCKKFGFYMVSGYYIYLH